MSTSSVPSPNPYPQDAPQPHGCGAFVVLLGPRRGRLHEAMNPETLLSLAAVMVGNGDISLRDDPITYAWRTLHPDDPPNEADVDAAAVHVSAVLGVPHSPDGWWLQLAGRDSLHIAALLANAAAHAKPREIEP